MENNIILRIYWVLLVLKFLCLEHVNCADQLKSITVPDSKEKLNDDSGLAKKIMEEIMDNNYRTLTDPRKWDIHVSKLKSFKDNAVNTIQVKIDENSKLIKQKTGSNKFKKELENQNKKLLEFQTNLKNDFKKTVTDSIKLSIDYYKSYHTIAAVYSESANQLIICGNVKFRSDFKMSKLLPSVDFLEKLAFGEKNLFEFDRFTLDETDVNSVKTAIKEFMEKNPNVEVKMLTLNFENMHDEYNKQALEKQIQTLKTKITTLNVDGPKNQQLQNLETEMEALKIDVSKRQQIQNLEKEMKTLKIEDWIRLQKQEKINKIKLEIGKDTELVAYNILAHWYHGEAQGLDKRTEIREILFSKDTSSSLGASETSKTEKRGSFVSVSRVPCENCQIIINEKGSPQLLESFVNPGKTGVENYFRGEQGVLLLHVIEIFNGNKKQDAAVSDSNTDTTVALRRNSCSFRRKRSLGNGQCVFTTVSDNDARKPGDVEEAEKINGKQIIDIDSKNYADLYEKNVGDVEFTNKLTNLGDENFEKFSGSTAEINKAKDLVKFTTGNSQVKVLDELAEGLKNPDKILEKLQTILEKLDNKLNLSPTEITKALAEENKAKIDKTKKIDDTEIDSFSKFVSKGNRLRNFESVGKVVGKVGKGMLAKGVVSSVIRGDSTGLMVLGGMMVADKGFTKGGEYLGKMALQTGSKFFKGVGKALGPIGGALTSGYDVYLLVNAVSRYTSNNLTKFEYRDALADIIDNSISIGVTVAVVGLSIAFLPFAPVFILVGSIISIFVSIVTQLYQAQNHLDSITNSIALSFDEKALEFGKKMIGLNTSQYIQNIIEVKSANEMQVKQIEKFLQHNTEFIGYVFPSFYAKKECSKRYICTKFRIFKETEFKVQQKKCFHVFNEKWQEVIICCDYVEHYLLVMKCCNHIEEFYIECKTNTNQRVNSIVSFSQKRNLYIERAAPKLQDSRQNLCLPNREYFNNEYTDKSQTKSYKCEGAIGIFHSGRVNGSLLIALEDGNDEAEGLLDTSNTFIVGNGNKLFKGGNLNDVFRLTGSNFSEPNTELDGGQSGTNLLILEQSSFQDDFVLYINLVSGEIYNSNNSTIKVKNIQNVIGRARKVERFLINCDTHLIMGNGGFSVIYPDEILIGENEDCANFSLEIHLNSFTNVTFKANSNISGNFKYSSNDHTSNYKIEVNSGQAFHTFILNHPISKLSHVNLQEKANFYHLLLGEGNLFLEKNISNDNTKINILSLIDGEIEAQVIIDFVKGSVQVYHLFKEAMITLIREGVDGANNIFNVFGYYDKVKLMGKSGDDVFIMNMTLPYSPDYEFDGGLGINTLILGNRFLSNKKIVIDLRGGQLNSDNNSVFFSVKNIQRVFGSEGIADTIVCNLDTLFVEGRGGGDTIYIPQELNSISKYNMEIKLDPNTNLFNHANNSGTFKYYVESPNFRIHNYNPNSDAKHELLFNFELSHLKKIYFLEESNSLNFDWTFYKNSSMKMQMSRLLNNSNFYSNPSFQFVEQKKDLGFEIISQIKVTSQGVSFVEISIDTLENVDYHNLENTNFTFKGLDDNSNIFKIGEEIKCFKEINGGSLDDIFWIHYDNNLENTNCDNILNGGKGENTLVLGRETEIDEIYVDLVNGMIFSWGQEYLFGLVNIQKFYGSAETSEIIVLNVCSTTFIDGMGTKDRVIVPPLSCKNNNDKEIVLVIREQTVVTFLPIVDENASTRSFIYSLNSKRSFSPVGGKNGGNHNHTIILPFSVLDLDYIFFSEQDKLKILYGFENNSWVYSHEIYPLQDIYAEPFYTQPKLVTTEGNVEIKVSLEGNVYFSLSKPFSMPYIHEILELYAPLANKLNITLIISEKEVDNILIQIGNYWEENAFTNFPNVASILVGNGGSSMYTIFETNSDVWIYHYEIGKEEEIYNDFNYSPPNKFKSVLDFTNVMNLIREKLGYKYVPEIKLSGVDLIFEFYSLDFKLILVKGNITYGGLGVLLNAQMMYIHYNETRNEYILLPVPININQGSVYIYSPLDFEDGTKIITNSSGSNTSITDLGRRGNDLVLSNYDRVNETDERPFIFTILHFYNDTGNETEISSVNNLTNIQMIFSDEEELQMDHMTSFLSVDEVKDFNEIVEILEESYFEKYPEIIKKFKESRVIDVVEDLEIWRWIFGGLFVLFFIIFGVTVVFAVKRSDGTKDNKYIEDIELKDYNDLELDSLLKFPI